MHQWQDVVLAISVLMFNVALLPSVWSKDKPALATSLLTIPPLAAGIVVFLSLSLWYSVIMQTINLSLWVTLALQVLKRGPQKSKRQSLRVR